MKSSVSAERLREVFDYDPDTGQLRRKIRMGSRGAVGALVGSIGSEGYRVVCIDGERYYAHRLIWLHVYGMWPNAQVDHVDGDRSNNCLSNLRDVNASQNQQNLRGARRNSSTGIKGVFWSDRSKKYTVQIGINGKRKSLGLFSDIDVAAGVYARAASKLHTHNPLAK